MAVRFTPNVLRAAAKRAVENRLGSVDITKGPGIVEGARLRTKKGLTIAIRTSLEREVGLMWHPSGHWRTITKVDLVVVAVPSVDDKEAAEVLAFDPEVMIKVFDAAVAKRRKGNSDFYKAPTFVALDDKPQKRSTSSLAGLKAKAKWKTTVRIDETMTRKSSRSETTGDFVERVKREFAELSGVDITKVVVEFRILS
jgi:hypothetical protein